MPPPLETFILFGELHAVTEQVGLEAMTKTLQKLPWKQPEVPVMPVML